MNRCEIETKTTVAITPALMAEIFWNMGSDQQAEFFHELHRVVTTQSPNAYGLGEMQWYYMADDIKKRSREAREMFLAFSGFAYDYWPQKTESEFSESRTAS